MCVRSVCVRAFVEEKFGQSGLCACVRESESLRAFLSVRSRVRVFKNLTTSKTALGVPFLKTAHGVPFS